MISVLNDNGEIIGDIEDISEDGETTWYATTIDNIDDGNVIDAEVCITESDAIEAVKRAHKEYLKNVLL